MESLLSPAAGAPQKVQPKCNIGVLAIFKGEAANLQKWLEYHLLIGVEHFWLAINDCLDEAASNATLGYSRTVHRSWYRHAGSAIPVRATVSTTSVQCSCFRTS
jgi:hypothetical protein